MKSSRGGVWAAVSRAWPSLTVDGSSLTLAWATLAVAFASLVPLVGLVMLALARLAPASRVRWGAWRWRFGWWWALAPLLLVALVHGLVRGSLPTLLVSLLLFAAAAALAFAPRRAVLVGGLLALSVLALGLGIERLAAERTFHDRSVHPDLDLRRWVSLASGVERFEARPQGIGLDRAWRAAAPVTSLVLSFEARLAPDTAVRVAQGAEPPAAWLGVAPLRASRAPWQEQAFSLSASWQRLEVALDPAALAAADAFRTPLRLAGDGVVEVRGLRLQAHDAAEVTALPSHPRQRLWFGGPNLVGHVLSMTGVIVMANAPGVVLAASAAALTLAGQAFTGSRTATAVFLAAAPLLLLLAARPRGRWLLLAGLLGLLALALVALDPADLGRLGVWSLDDRNVLSRSVEMRDAWGAMLADPWRGAGEGGLPALAHNAWLQFGGEYGLPGAAAGLWWAAAVLTLGWRWGGLRGLVLVAAFLALQLSDDSWRYPGVFLPMLLGLAALAAEQRGGAGPVRWPRA